MLDLSALYACYAPVGGEAYAPEILLGLLFYGYATGVFSSRKIEKATYESIPFRFIAGGLHPDHDTIAHFRKTFLSQITATVTRPATSRGRAPLCPQDTIVVDRTPPEVSTWDIVKDTPYAHRVSTDTVWYGTAGSVAPLRPTLPCRSGRATPPAAWTGRSTRRR